MSTSNTPAPASSTPFFIKNIVDQCTRIGVVLFVMDNGIHATPVGLLTAHPGLLELVRRHKEELAQYLDSLVA